MSSSDYHSLLLSKNGIVRNNTFVTPLRIEVQVHKNWLYIKDFQAWENGGQFSVPTVMEIRHGLFTYKDVMVFAKRGPNRGIYFVIWVEQYAQYYFDFVVGLGMSAYRDWVAYELKKLNLYDKKTKDNWTLSSTITNQVYLKNLEKNENILIHDAQKGKQYNFEQHCIDIQKKNLDYLNERVFIPWRNDRYHFIQKEVPSNFVEKYKKMVLRKT
jgi:hypothetical protein